MNPAEPLTISTTALTAIKRLARRAKTDRDAETELYYAITKLPPEEKLDLMALFTLGRPGLRSFNVARKTAASFNPEHVAGHLAGTAMFHDALTKGLRRHKKHS